MNINEYWDKSIDVLRVIALFLVVLVHTHRAELTVDTISHSLETSMFFLGKLGVPLFVMISGAVLLPRTESASTFYKKRINKILLPWFFWSVLFFLYKVSTVAPSSYSILNLIKEFFVVMLSDFWFMPMIVGVYLLTPYLRALVTTKIQLKYIFIAWFTVTSLLPYLYLSPLFPGTSSSGVLGMSISFCGYFLLGWYIKKNWLQNFSSFTVSVTLGISALFYLLSAHLFKESANQLFFALQDYFSPPLVVGSVSLFLLVYKKSQHIIKLFSPNFIETLSRISYGTFLSHVLISLVVSSLLPNLFQAHTDLVSWLIRAILVYSGSALLIYGGTHVGYLKKFLT